MAGKQERSCRRGKTTRLSSSNQGEISTSPVGLPAVLAQRSLSTGGRGVGIKKGEEEVLSEANIALSRRGGGGPKVSVKKLDVKGLS